MSVLRPGDGADWSGGLPDQWRRGLRTEERYLRRGVVLAGAAYTTCRRPPNATNASSRGSEITCQSSECDTSKFTAAYIESDLLSGNAISGGKVLF